MPVIRRLSAVATLALLAGACAPKAPAPVVIGAAADSVDQQFLAAFNKGDVDAIMATYWQSPSLVSIGLGGMGLQGWDATKASWVELFGAMPGAQLEFTTHQNEAFGDVAIGSGTWKLTMPVAGGDTQVMQGRYSDVKALRDAKWVYVMDHASVPLPPAPAAAAAAATPTK
jgi:ketosteroid isomerase-like protein